MFRWTFEGHSSDVESGNEPVLRWVKFADSSYEVIPSIEALETVGFQGHVILIEGMRTGSARVSVRLEDDAFKVINPILSLVYNLYFHISYFFLERTDGRREHCRCSQSSSRSPRVVSAAGNYRACEAQSDQARTARGHFTAIVSILPGS